MGRKDAPKLPAAPAVPPGLTGATPDLRDLFPGADDAELFAIACSVDMIAADPSAIPDGCDEMAGVFVWLCCLRRQGHTVVRCGPRVIRLGKEFSLDQVAIPARKVTRL